MNAIEIFDNGEFRARTSTDSEGRVWFVAQDIAEALEYTEVSSLARLFASVPEVWCGVKTFYLMAEKGEVQRHEMLCLSEQGLYFFLARSEKPKTLSYQMWIGEEVMPSIRKRVLYMTPQMQAQLILDPDFIIRLAQELKAERIKVKALRTQTACDRSKVIFAEAIDASSSTIRIKALAKILRQNGVKIREKQLLAWLREKGYLKNSKGKGWNTPTPNSIKRGLFKVNTRIINNPDGSTQIIRTTKVTGRGQIYFINQLLRNPIR